MSTRQKRWLRKFKIAAGIDDDDKAITTAIWIAVRWARLATSEELGQVSEMVKSGMLPGELEKKGMLARRERRWKDHEIAMLGRHTDSDVARIIERTKGAVQIERRRRRIPPFKIPGRVWTQAEDKVLGTDKDRIVAAKLGRTTGAVTLRRQQLGIRGFSADVPPEKRFGSKHE